MSVYRRRVMQVKHPPNQITAVYNVTSTTSATKLFYRYYNKSLIQKVIVDGETINQSVADHQTYTFLTTGLHEVVLIVNGGAESIEGLFYQAEDLVSVDFQMCKNTWSNVSALFDSCYKLEEVKGLHLTNSVQKCRSMCRYCYALNIANIEGLESWDLSNVTNMSAMFYECKVSTDLTPLANWDVSNVTNMESMLGACAFRNLTPLANWDVSNVTNMSGILSNNKKLTDITGLANWDVSNVTNMNRILNSCSSLKNLSGLENWDISKVTDLGWAFGYCNALSNISAVSQWDTNKVKTIEGLLASDYGLTDITPIANWDVSNVTSIYYTFYKCTKLTKIDISAWDLSKVKNMEYAFYKTTSLVELRLNTEINTSPGIYSSTFQDAGTSTPTLYYYPHASFVEKFLPKVPAKWTKIDITTLE